MSSTKKKVIISLSSLVAVILIAACAFVAVWAARNATVTSKFSVTYTADHVLATITGKYQVEGASAATDMTPASISFTASDVSDGNGNSTKSFDDVSLITFTEESSYVDFTYTIKNDETSQTISVTLTTDITGSGYDIAYSVGGSPVTFTSGTQITTIDANATETITIRIGVADLDEDCSITSGTFTFHLDEVTA